MRILLALALLLLAAPALAQPAPQAAPPGQPITLSPAEQDALIEALADAPARHVYRAIAIIVSKREQAEAAARAPAPKGD